MWIAETWAEIDKLIFAACIPTQWDIRGGEALRGDTSYLVISNHQSWVDIPALIQALNRRTPFFKFFLKKELIWVPFLGLAWWALDYPFMKRYTKAFLAKHPELAGQDLKITKEACELFKRQPVTVVNYLEGTRFSEAKRKQQDSPFNRLLKPKAGGVAFVLAAMGEQLDAILDVTVVYPQQKIPGFWDLISGAVPKVVAGGLRKRSGVSPDRPELGQPALEGKRRAHRTAARAAVLAAGAPGLGQLAQYGFAGALAAQVLQDHRGKLADHAVVHAQGAERGVQVVGVFHVTQQAVQAAGLAAAGLAEHAAQGTKAAQRVVAGQLVQPRHALGQLRIVIAAQLVLRQAQHRAGTADGLLGGDIELRGQGRQQAGSLRCRRGGGSFVVATLHAGDGIGCIAKAETCGEYRSRGHGQQAGQGKTA
jgi:1-acyl-sn-glycerol-3-phosphate acyltransferase